MTVTGTFWRGPNAELMYTLNGEAGSIPHNPSMAVLTGAIGEAVLAAMDKKPTMAAVETAKAETKPAAKAAKGTA